MKSLSAPVGMAMLSLFILVAGLPRQVFAVTDTAPPTGTIVINNNRTATNTPNVTLGLTWSDGTGTGVSRMRFSDNGSTWTAWEAPAPTRAHTLPSGDGYKTVRVQYMDRAGNRSLVCADYIRLDTAPPRGTITINGGDAATINPEVTLGLTWSDGSGSGVSCMRFSDNGSTWTAWEAFKTPKTHLLPAGLGYHTVRVQFVDAAGNYSSVFSDYIKQVATDPHLVAVVGDTDLDYLSDTEEIGLGSNPAISDENGNSVPDGIDLAIRMHGDVGRMPWFASAGDPQYGLNPPDLESQFPTDRPFVISFDYLVDCVWICPVCGAALPAGRLQVVNPALHAGWKDGFQIPLPAWHFVEHGSFSFVGDGCVATGQSRLDVPGLVRAVTGMAANTIAAQWLQCGSEPNTWTVEVLPLGMPLNGVRISGPTPQYSNACAGEVALGGKPCVIVDHAAHLLTLVTVGTAPDTCPLVYDPVCGLQTQIIGLESGVWAFTAPILNPAITMTFQL